MANNIITLQTLVDGDRDTVIKATILGTGAGEDVDVELIPAPAEGEYKLWKIWYCLNGFYVHLKWDATTNVQLMALAQDHPHYTSYEEFGGLINNAGAGKTGKILFTTFGIVGAELGHIIFHFKKINVPVIR